MFYLVRDANDLIGCHNQTVLLSYPGSEAYRHGYLQR